MSWRLSRRKLERVDAQEQAERARGWRADAEGWLTPLATCEAVQLRRGVIRGQCRVGGCRRHVRFDPARWVRHGFGQLEVVEALAAHRCGLTECGLAFDPEAFPFGGPPLGALLRHAQMTAELTCQSCRWTCAMSGRLFVAAAAHARLGDLNTRIESVGEALAARCPACDARRWRTLPGFLRLNPYAADEPVDPAEGLAIVARGNQRV